ncbi:hypothetical protein SAMN02800687_0291 [Curtobacterium sp. UNCCL20]|nr:hypothetical protein SAMN02800687_0291 [Curtobacterium sp. UNCCL20]
MTKCKQRSWTAATVLVACLTAGSVLGTGVSAQAAIPTAQTSTSLAGAAPARSSTAAPNDTQGIASSRTSGPSSTTSPATGRVETRSWAALIRTAINALKKVPALWKKVVDGAKKSLASFKANVWPAIKATVNLVSALLTAQEIWKFFN